MAKARFQLYARGFDGFGWRFVASNNRDLARSPEPFADEDAATSGVQELRVRIADLKASTYMDPNGRWRWDVRSGGERLAESSRWYYRRVECEQTMTQFLSGCAEADLSTTVLGWRGGTAAAPDYLDLTTVLPGQRSPGRPLLGRSA